jgi:hypothetical protein
MIGFAAKVISSISAVREVRRELFPTGWFAETIAPEKNRPCGIPVSVEVQQRKAKH